MNPESGNENPESAEQSSQSEFSVEDVTRRLKEAEAVRAQRVETDITDRVKLIGRAKQLDAILRQGEEQVEYFETKFDLDPHRDQAEIELLAKLKEDTERTRQALSETNQRIDKISEKPEVMTRVQREAEGIHEVKEKIAGAPERIDEIKKLLDQASAMFDESNNKIIRQINEKSGEISELKKSARVKTDNNDLLRAIDNLGAGNWQQDSENLQRIRKNLGVFKGKDKAVIDQISVKFPPLSQELDALYANRKEVDQKRIDALAQAEENRTLMVEEILDYKHGVVVPELEELRKLYKEKIGRGFYDKLKY